MEDFHNHALNSGSYFFNFKHDTERIITRTMLGMFPCPDVLTDQELAIQ